MKQLLTTLAAVVFATTLGTAYAEEEKSYCDFTAGAALPGIEKILQTACYGTDAPEGNPYKVEVFLGEIDAGLDDGTITKESVSGIATRIINTFKRDVCGAYVNTYLIRRSHEVIFRQALLIEMDKRKALAK